MIKLSIESGEPRGVSPAGAMSVIAASGGLCYRVAANRIQNTLLPTIVAGVLTPNSARIDGAMSTKLGLAARIGRLLNRMPGTSRASAQWSALQAESLSSKTSSVMSPKTVAQDAR